MANKNTTKKSGSAVTAVICVILAIMLVGGLAWGVYSKFIAGNGHALRSKTAAESENFKITGTEMAYAASTAFQNIYSQLSQLGVDLDTSLKEQYLPGGEGDEQTSYFDYITTATKSNVSQILALCEYAKANGIELNDEDKESVKATLASFEDAATQYGYPSAESFVKAAFRNGVNLKDIENFVSLSVLYSKAGEALTGTLDATLEEAEALYAEKPENFDGVDFYAYTVTLPEEAEDSEEAEDAEEAETTDALDAIAFATTLSNAKDAEEFKALVEDYAGEEAAANTLRKHITKANISDEAISEWLFSAKAGEIKLFENEGAYSVILLDKEAYRNEVKTRSVRHILVEADEENEEDDSLAQDILAQLKEADFSEDKWNELAEKYSIDNGSNANGGLYEGIPEGETMAEFNDWLYDADRAEGDSGIVKTSAGWHVMYFVGETDDEAWLADAKNEIKGNKFTEEVEKWSEGITFNDDVINTIEVN